MNYIADKIALKALTNDNISSNAYKLLSNTSYGKMLTAFCIFYHSLLNNDNRILLDAYVESNFSIMFSKYKMLLLICKHAPVNNDIAAYLDPLEPLLTELEITKTDSITVIKTKLNAKFQMVLDFLKNQQGTLENMLNDGFNTIKNSLTQRGGKSKKNKRKQRRTRRLRKMLF